MNNEQKGDGVNFHLLFTRIGNDKIKKSYQQNEKEKESKE